MKFATLAVIVKDNKLLLGYKKRGFAKGILNGPGGKVESYESSEECIIRETKEEVGISIKNPELRGVLEFFSNHDKDWIVFVFYVDSFEGSVSETDEIRPKWVPVNEIPYDEMWSDDPVWLPYVLKGKRIHAVFRYENEKMIDYEVKELC
ncbi:MAG: NUDIX domain-containing protein [Nitrospiraceae bacterium]|nr:NUDIX domain-containing protein [Nitrospiraceae bacterium]